MSFRHRENVDGPFYETLSWVQDSDGTVAGTVTCPMWSSHEIMDDVVTPDFAARRAKGELFNNPCTYREDRYRASGTGSYQSFNNDGSLRQHSVGGDVTFGMASIHEVGLAPFIELGTTGELVELTRFQSLDRMDKTPHAFLEDAFEVRETLAFIKSPFQEIRRLAELMKKDLKRKGLKPHALLNSRSTVAQLGHETAAQAKTLSGVWLEYRFAFSPLVRSAVEAHESLLNKKMTRPRRQTSRGFTADEASSHENVISSNGLGAHFDRKCSSSLDVTSGVLYEVTNPLRDVHFRNGLRAKDIPEGIWAVMPYSFMVDRVIDISGSIRGLTNLLDPNLRRLAAWDTVKERMVCETTCLKQDHPTVNVDVHGGPYVSEKFTYSRNPWDVKLFHALPPPPQVAGLVAEASSILDLAALILR